MSSEDDKSGPPFSRYGKLGKELFDKVIYPNLGAVRSEVIVGPQAGVDTCAILIGSNQAIVATTDPISFIPELGARDSAWMSVNLLANDLATTGFKPQYLMLDFNLPPEMEDGDFSEYWIALSEECTRLGIAIVGGHSGRFEGCNYTIIGAGTMFSTGAAKGLTSKGARLGDNVIVTKGAAISASALLAKMFPGTVREKLGEQLQQQAASNFQKISVLDDALTAVSVGVGISGVTAMHDVTEGGVLSALYEVAHASSLGITIEKNEIQVSDETRKVCDLFGVNPYVALGEGALVIACNPIRSQEVLEVLHYRGISATIVGTLVEPENGIKVLKEDGSSETFSYPIEDPYWKAYYKASSSK